MPIGGILGKVVNPIQEGLGSVGDVLSGKDLSKVGLGRYKGQSYDVNKEAFYDTGELKKRQEALASEQAARIGQAAGPEAAQQAGLAAALQAQMAGTGPSLAQTQLKQATDRNIAQAMAMAQQRGGSPYLAQRQAMQAAATAGQEAAGQSAAIRAQEQLAAQSQLAGVLQQQRAASVQEQQLRDAMSQFYAGQQTGLTQEQMKSRQAYEALMSGNMAEYNRMASQAYQAQQGAQSGLLGGLIQAGGTAAMMAAMSDKRVKKNVKEADFTELDGFVKMAEGGMVEDKDELKKWAQAAQQYADLSKGTEKMSGTEKMGYGVGQGIGSLFMSKKPQAGGGQPMAGESLLPTANLAYKGGYCAEGGIIPGKAKVKGDSEKNDVVPALLSPGEAVIPRTVMDGDKEKIQDFIDKLKAYQYEYKDKKHGEGEHASVMAQDLEKSELGKTAVMDTPEGKMVDYGKLAAPMLAHQVMMAKKIEDLEDALKLKKRGK